MRNPTEGCHPVPAVARGLLGRRSAGDEPEVRRACRAVSGHLSLHVIQLSNREAENSMAPGQASVGRVSDRKQREVMASSGTSTTGRRAWIGRGSPSHGCNGHSRMCRRECCALRSATLR